MTLQQHFEPGGTKRILALDGGGIRGALTLGYLQRIEDILREQQGNKDSFRLSDYFDLIGGTSTGSIIASCLAIGMKVSEITELYMRLGGKIFSGKYQWWNVFTLDDLIKAGYDEKPLVEELQAVFGDITLGSDKIKTGICIITKRADTNSVWMLINHPKGKFFDSQYGKNSEILLWKAVRASTAAPGYFIPQIIDVGGGMPAGAFVDGGVSMANNPALQLLMVATLKGFPFHWEMGPDKLMLVSIGTGMGRITRMTDDITDNHLLSWAKEIPEMFMQDASWHNQLLLQWMAKSPTAWEIDGEVGKLENDLIVVDKDKRGLFSYLRYNVWLDQPTLQQLMGREYSKEQINNLVEMSNAESRFELFDIGAKAAAAQIEKSHFAKMEVKGMVSA